MENVNILVVDDIKINYLVLKGMLKSTAANVLWACDHEEAVDICNKYTIHLVLMDFQLPGMNGYELSKLLKKDHHQLPVIFQTANAHAITSLVEGFNQPGEEVEVLQKPIQRQILLDKVHTYIS
jgi:CheY-like chemotaxis protein